MKVKFQKQLLVEGKDDKHVILALCQKFEVTQNFEVIDCNGVDRVREQLPVRFKQAAVNTIGIIVDADVEIKERWQSISSILKAQEFEVPSQLPQDGLIVENKMGKKVGVWIMPNNNLNGMLEDFISFLIPTDDKLFPIVNETLSSIEKKGINKYNLLHKSKASIHFWFALQEDPGTPLGQAITKKYLSTDEDTCYKLINWLKELYSL